MTKLLYIFILTLAQLLCCVPEIEGLNAGLLKNKSSQETEKEGEKEKEKEESSLTRMNELSEKVITQFYYISSDSPKTTDIIGVSIQRNPIVNPNGIYLQYSNLKI